MARPVTLFTGYWDFRSIGHGDINEPVPLGVRVRLDATTAQLTFMESAVSEQ